MCKKTFFLFSENITSVEARIADATKKIVQAELRLDKLKTEILKQEVYFSFVECIISKHRVEMILSNMTDEIIL